MRVVILFRNRADEFLPRSRTFWRLASRSATRSGWTLDLEGADNAWGGGGGRAATAAAREDEDEEKEDAVETAAADGTREAAAS